MTELFHTNYRLYPLSDNRDFVGAILDGLDCIGALRELSELGVDVCPERIHKLAYEEEQNCALQQASIRQVVRFRIVLHTSSVRLASGVDLWTSLIVTRSSIGWSVTGGQMAWSTHHRRQRDRLCSALIHVGGGLADRRDAGTT